MKNGHFFKDTSKYLRCGECGKQQSNETKFQVNNRKYRSKSRELCNYSALYNKKNSSIVVEENRSNISL